MRRLLPLLLLLLLAAPARADWTAPLPAGAVDGAVAGDGTTVVGAYTGSAAVAQVDDGPAATFPGRVGAPLVAAADGGRGVVAYADTSGTFYGATAATRVFGDAQALGDGLPVDVAASARGDAAILARTPLSTLLVTRSATGRWSPPQTLTGARTAVVLTATGRAVTDPVDVTRGARTALAADGTGRVLAAWATETAILTAVRSAVGTWSAPVTHPVDDPGPPRADVSRAGDAVIAWRDGGDGALNVLTGDLLTQAFVQERLDDRRGGSAPALAVASDGSALLAYGDGEDALRVTRRAGTAPFGAPEVAACVAFDGPPSAGLDDAGHALLVAPPFLVRDAAASGATAAFVTPVGGAGGSPGTVGARAPVDRLSAPAGPTGPTGATVPTTGPTGAAPAPSRCDVGDPRALYALDRVTVGVPVAVTVLGLGDPVRLVKTFRRPGRARWSYAGHRFTVKVFARARIRARRTGDTVVVRANANAATGRARSCVLIEAGRRVLARRTLRLGARPRTVRLPLPPGATGRLSATLLRGKRFEARTRVRAQ